MYQKFVFLNLLLLAFEKVRELLVGWMVYVDKEFGGLEWLRQSLMKWNTDDIVWIVFNLSHH